jgi:hypothetical protein
VALPIALPASLDGGSGQRFSVGSRTLVAGECFDSYRRFAAERMRIFHQRADGMPGPWTDDPVLSRHKFTNVYRAADRISQYLIPEVIYAGCKTRANATNDHQEGARAMPSTATQAQRARSFIKLPLLPCYCLKPSGHTCPVR